MSKILKECDFVYRENDLGAVYTMYHTTFKVWAPTMEKVAVVIYENFNYDRGRKYLMNKEEHGIWMLKLDGDYKNKYYNYLVIKDGLEKETPDLYAKGATSNGKKGMIIDFDSINPDNWHDHYIPSSINKSEAIIYELHVRDFSVSKHSGIKNKGKYLAFTEKNTTTPEGVSTGLDHLKDLGITHVHLLPVFDFASVDEIKGGYNWGYDPYLYNVPEGSYSTESMDGTVRIAEFKAMVQSLHENGIGVIMDVVYNHTFKWETSPMEMLVPGYYYRTDEHGNYSNGSGCGNEIASEKPMARKFIVDSIKFWMTEYKIDGFRFDLMALIDIDTMMEIEHEARKINPNVIVYGEPWTGGSSSLPPKLQMTKGIQKGTQISVFNDNMRNAIKGDNDGTQLGFVNGGQGKVSEIKNGIVGSIKYSKEIHGFTDEPCESINYVSSHDNLCLFDKFEISNKNYTYLEREKMNRLALSMVLTSYGVPFIQGGTEILRTKQGHPNSYNAGDAINEIDWSRKAQYKETYEYIKGMIGLRKSQKSMTIDKAEEIKRTLKFLEIKGNAVAYEITSSFKDDYSKLIIIHNANKHEEPMILPDDKEWIILANQYEVNINGVSKGSKTCINQIVVPSLSTFILCKP